MLVEAACNISENKDLQLNVRTTTLLFLEMTGERFNSRLAKKSGELLRKVIQSGFKIACEDTEEFADEEDTPHDLALSMLYVYACELPNEVVYPIFKHNIQLCAQQADPLAKKAGLRILGYVCDPDGLLDFVRDDIDNFTEFIVSGLTDASKVVRDAACLTMGDFSEHVIPDFLDQHPTVMPVLLSVLEAALQNASATEEDSNSASRAFYALSEFIQNMEDYEV